MTYCPVCEAPTAKPGLCPICAASPSLVAAFREGRDRKAGWEPMALLGEMTDAAAEDIGQ